MTAWQEASKAGLRAIEERLAERMVPNEVPRRAVLSAIERGDVTWADLARDRGQIRPHTASITRALRGRYMSREWAEMILAANGVGPRYREAILVPAPKGYSNGRPYVETAPIRPWAARMGKSAIARRLGQFQPDAAHLKTMLGVKATKNGRYQDRMDYDTAVWLCRRLEFDPVDWDL